MPPVPSFGASHLQAMCEAVVLGITGTEIENLLARCEIDDFPATSKARRLFGALNQRQVRDRCGNAVAAFILAVMEPVRWAGRSDAFNEMRLRVNRVLVFSGYAVVEDGALSRVAVARTLSEAEERADRLLAGLQKRGVHGDVLRFCRAELLQENYFHAVFEATKSVADKIRQRTGLTTDGSELVDQALGLHKDRLPMLAYNSVRTETERSEHTGMMNLLKGMFGVFRNVTAHAPKISWPIGEQDAMDLLSIASFLHRRLDNAVLTQVER